MVDLYSKYVIILLCNLQGKNQLGFVGDFLWPDWDFILWDEKSPSFTSILGPNIFWVTFSKVSNKQIQVDVEQAIWS